MKSVSEGIAGGQIRLDACFGLNYVFISSRKHWYVAGIHYNRLVEVLLSHSTNLNYSYMTVHVLLYGKEIIT